MRRVELEILKRKNTLTIFLIVAICIIVIVCSTISYFIGVDAGVKICRNQYNVKQIKDISDQQAYEIAGAGADVKIRGGK
jgi:hypothetical protein